MNLFQQTIFKRYQIFADLFRIREGTRKQQVSLSLHIKKEPKYSSHPLVHTAISGTAFWNFSVIPTPTVLEQMFIKSLFVHVYVWREKKKSKHAIIFQGYNTHETTLPRGLFFWCLDLDSVSGKSLQVLQKYQLCLLLPFCAHWRSHITALHTLTARSQGIVCKRLAHTNPPCYLALSQLRRPEFTDIRTKHQLHYLRSHIGKRTVSAWRSSYTLRRGVLYRIRRKRATDC